VSDKGRPTKYSDEVQAKADAYIDNYFTKHNHAVPSAVGLARVLKVSKKTLYNWANEHEAFLHTLDIINDQQELDLMNGGLNNTLNTPITKLMMANHGYSDKVDQNLTSSDGSMSPIGIELVGIEPAQRDYGDE
jgi:hypothetical protein